MNLQIREHGHLREGPAAEERSVVQAMARGARLRCPNCRRGRLFESYLKVRDTCADCGEALHHHRADDAPPYFTVFIVGHVIVSLILSVEVALRPPLWLHFSLWIPLTLLLTLFLLPPIKGALVGLQWALRMHGFDPNNGSQGDA